MKPMNLAVITGLAALMVAHVSVHAQGLAVSATGTKKVTLSDRVGANQFTWASDAPLEQIKGTAGGISGTITIDPKNLSTMRGTISATVSTMKTGNGTRDGHLKGEAWLDASKYPTISFAISSVKDIKVNGTSATGTAVGKFTMHGVTKELSIPFTLKYIPESTATRERAPGDLIMVSADFTIALKDFNVAGAKGLVGSKVGEEISVKAQLFGSTGL